MESKRRGYISIVKLIGCTPNKDYFLDVSEKWDLDSLGLKEWNPSFLLWINVDRWKPLGLSADVEERVLAEIEKWFEEDER